VTSRRSGRREISTALPRANGRRFSTRFRVIASVLAVLLLAVTAGCHSLGYYSQAVRGHLQIICRATAIKKVLADPQTPESLKEKLRLVLALRDYAERDLKLPPNRHYLKYADLERRFVVWNVYAAPEFSLEARTWWYPVVGSLKYQGYFAESNARKYAEKLAARGYDVFVGGVEAYSTLGWFSDPVLNTFIHDDDSDLAELLFHELAHERVFVAGDTDFNEAFATAVAEQGVRQWLRSAGRSSELEQYELEGRRRGQFVALVIRARERLGQLYGESGESESVASKASEAAERNSLRLNKQIVLDDLRRDYEQLKSTWGGNGGYDSWFKQPLNNAHLNDVDTCYALVPAFRWMWESDNGDWKKFYADVEALGKLRKEERHRRLKELGAK